MLRTWRCGFDSCRTGQILKVTQMKKIIEIRAAEGGEDSKLFVKDLAQAYIRLASRHG